ncbi:ABC transporter permease [Labrys monachus]|uniref:Autoinducer 2 import system permease protein LsrD n=1 Tax=Labrys monachus TaxID=217067 RepID=A0ABU0FJH7_9HYPH|nr:ABC transporter permease [Labrys monachus]MDQ0394760.1 ribose transport system permease protein [Labrys monachus]
MSMPSAPLSRRLSHFARERRETGLAVLLLVVLLVLNFLLNPARFLPANWGSTIGLAAPLVVGAVAAMPAILGGRGGIDVSVGPAMGFVNAVIVQVLILDLGLETPWLIVPAALLTGIGIGIFNGLVATMLRIQPIVATLGTYLLLSGLTLTLVPSPIGSVPPWIKDLAGTWSILPILLVAAAWVALKRLPFHDALMAVGSDDRAAYTAGVPVLRVRFLSYVTGGLFAGVAGLSLTALIGSADPNVGPNYTLVTISAVALGGVSLAGGRGGFLAAALGAVDIFLLQNALTFFNLSPFVLQVAYGVILVLSVSLNALPALLARGREARS